MNIIHRFKEGEIVYDSARPNQRMVVVGCERNIYTCMTQDSIQRMLIFPARELKVAAA